MTEKEIKIEARERTDYRVLQQICHYDMRRKPPGSKWDAVTENAVVEIKNRDKYTYDDFDTFSLSLHKLDHLELGKKEEDKPYSAVVAIYPLSNKVVIFDTTNLNAKNAKIEWKRVKKTQYDTKEPIYVWQPKVMLDLTEGKHTNYRTIVLDTDLSWVEEDYENNIREIKKTGILVQNQ